MPRKNETDCFLLQMVFLLSITEKLVRLYRFILCHVIQLNLTVFMDYIVLNFVFLHP